MTPLPGTIVVLLSSLTALVGTPVCWLTLPLLGVSAPHTIGCCIALLAAGIVLAGMAVRDVDA